MNRPRITEAGNDHLTEDQRQQLEDALRILARMITRAVLRERSLLERSQHGGPHDSAVRTYPVTTAREPNEPLTVSIKEAAKILGVSGNSAYTAVHTGQIPSIRFGSRILIPRVALEKMLSEADKRGSERR
jgi:excisionase family DNA binding protein